MRTLSTKRKISVSLLLSLFLFALPALGSVWYVDGDAPPGGDGQSWAEAFF